MSSISTGAVGDEICSRLEYGAWNRYAKRLWSKKGRKMNRSSAWRRKGGWDISEEIEKEDR